MRVFKLVNIYIAKGFLVKFLQILLGFSLLIFFVNFLDISDKAQENKISFAQTVFIAFLQIPDFLNDVVSSLVLIAAIITFFIFSSRSEITIMRASGLSLWRILMPISLAAFFLGIFWVAIFNPIAIKMVKKSDSLQRQKFQNNSREVVVAPKNSIWLKQENILNRKEELVIQARDALQENLEFRNVTIWFFDKNNQFYKKIDVQTMFLLKDEWLLKDLIVNDKDHLNQKIAEATIKTDLDGKFIMKKIVNNFQNVKLFSIFELPKLITEMNNSGFSVTKFKVYFQSLLITPILFVAMVLLACFFGLNHVRNNNAILMIFLGIIAGLLLYITSSVIMTFGSSGIISIFASTWVIALICLSLGILLIYKKENL